jgi:hypothetical protein
MISLQGPGWEDPLGPSDVKFLFHAGLELKEMPSSDEQYRINSRQRREIDQIGQKFHFNLAPPPRSLEEITTCPKFVSLTDFIEQFEDRRLAPLPASRGPLQYKNPASK